MGRNNYRLADAFEEVAAKLEGSGLTEEAFSSVDSAITFIRKKMKVTSNQVFILATLLRHAGKNMETTDFSTFANTSPLRIMVMQKDFDTLSSKGMIECVKPISYNSWQQTFAVSLGTVQSVKYNKLFTSVTYENLSVHDVLDVIVKLLKDCDYDRITYYEMLRNIKKLLDSTQHLEFSKKLKKIGGLDTEFILFLIAVACYVDQGEEHILKSDYDDILPAISQRHIKRMFKNKKGFLYENNLLEAIDDTFESYRLTLNAKCDFLKEFDIEDEDIEEKTEGINDVAKSNIVEKKLFYNKEEHIQIERLSQLLDVDKFKDVQSRMRSAGMRTGFTCLFFGQPGTGKTETVFQIARATGREIIQVNLAAIKNCYVGESEKNIQRVFDEYRDKLQKSSVAPILFFNEADGILGKRYLEVDNAANQMENTIQNIILQNMETFEGILIATTNLKENFDKAFERRFLYKIEFKSPDEDVRRLIWLSFFPNLSDKDAAILAAKYKFNGGQIENISRKQLVESVLYNHQLSLFMLLRLCDEESLKSEYKG